MRKVYSCCCMQNPKSFIVNNSLSFTLTALQEKWQTKGPLAVRQALTFTQRSLPEENTDQGFGLNMNKLFELQKYPIWRLYENFPSRIAIQNTTEGREAGTCTVSWIRWFSWTEITQVQLTLVCVTSGKSGLLKFPELPLIWTLYEMHAETRDYNL